MDYAKTLGFQPELTPAARNAQRTELLQYINLKLAANGLPVVFDNAPTHGVAPVSDAQEATMAAYSDYLFLDPPDTT